MGAYPLLEALALLSATYIIISAIFNTDIQVKPLYGRTGIRIDRKS